MRITTGWDKPTAGRITVSGRDYHSAAASIAELGFAVCILRVDA